MKRLLKRAGLLHIYGKSQRLFPFRVQFRWNYTGYRKCAPHADFQIIHQCCCNFLRCRHGIHIQISPRRKCVHCKFSMKIRCRRNHRFRSGKLCHQKGQFIGSANMAGQKRDGMPSLLIHHDHRRVCLLALHVRGNAPHGNSRGADKNQKVFGTELLRRPF